jgi:hypothetical protein
MVFYRKRQSGKVHFFNRRKPMRLAVLQKLGPRAFAGRFGGDENAFGTRAPCRAVWPRYTDRPRKHWGQLHTFDSAEKPPCFENSPKIQEMESSIGSSRIDCGRLFSSDGTVLAVFQVFLFDHRRFSSRIYIQQLS